MADFQCHAIQLRKYAKTLAKIQFSAIFHMRDIQRNILPKFIEICLEKPCCWPSGWLPTWQPENENICHRGLLRRVNSSLKELTNIRVHKITKFPQNKSDFLTYMIALSHNGLAIQAYSITKRRSLSKWKCV